MGRVFVLPAVTPGELLDWTASADVMVMAIQPTTVNHRFTTPQKLFEAIAAGVPVVASDLPGMAPIVRESGVGELCDPTVPVSIAAAIRRIVEPARRRAGRARGARPGGRPRALQLGGPARDAARDVRGARAAAGAAGGACGAATSAS